MRLSLLLLFAGGLGCLTGVARAQTTSALAAAVQRQQWQHRVVLYYAPDSLHADFRRQQAVLARQVSALRERDVVVMPLLLAQLTAADRQYLTRHLQVPPQGFTALLIGKDGGVKSRQQRPLDPTTLFSTIDKMPMRRQEMKPR